MGVRALRFLPRSASLIMAVEGAHDLVPDGPAQRGRGIHGQYVYWITMSHPRPETVQQLSLRTLALLPAPPSCLTAPELRPTALEVGARAADPPTTPRSPLRRAYLSAPLRPPPYHFTASTRLVDRKVYKNIWNIIIVGRVLARVLVLSFKIKRISFLLENLQAPKNPALKSAPLYGGMPHGAGACGVLAKRPQAPAPIQTGSPLRDAPWSGGRAAGARLVGRNARACE